MLIKNFQSTITITIILLVIQIVSPNFFVQGQPYNPALENQFGNPSKIKLFLDDTALILNQTMQKSAYRMGEDIDVNAELINVGNSSVKIKYCEPWVAFEIKNQSGFGMWPKSQMGCIPEFSGKITLLPGEHFSIKPWTTSSGYVASPPRLENPGNYTVLSVAAFSLDSSFYGQGQVESLWSKPLQIVILPEKVPEFPISSIVLLIATASVIVFYRIKSTKI